MWSSAIRCLVGLVCLAPLGCDGGARLPDAQAQVWTISSELSVRFEVDVDKPATVSVLGFRAATTGSDEADVLGLVDPLAAAAPEQGCALRDADRATQALISRGGSVDLEELGGFGIGWGAGASDATVIRPFPRVYPDVAGAVTGVVAEAGPQPVRALPERLTLLGANGAPIAELAVPALPRLVAINGAAPAAATRVDVTGGLTLTLANAAGALVELRPFGSTVVVSCAVTPTASTETVVSVPRALLAHLGRGAAPAVSIEVARRLRPREASLAARGTRVSVEVRSAVAVELLP